MKLNPKTINYLSGVQVYCKNASEKLWAIKLLTSLSEDVTTPHCLSGGEHNMDMGFPFIGLDCLHVTARARLMEGYEEITVQELFDFCLKSQTFNSPIEVVLSPRYTALVYPDKVVVACQTFPITIIAELAAAHEKVKN